MSGEFERPIVTVDIVLMTIHEGRLCVALIEREAEPFREDMCAMLVTALTLDPVIFYSGRFSEGSDPMELVGECEESQCRSEILLALYDYCVRSAVMAKEKKDVSMLIPEISPLQLNGPPGACFFGGRAHAQDVVGRWPTLIDRSLVQLETFVEEVE